jgi:hypothetical protein
MPRILHPEFRDEQLYSRYPFADGASLTSRGGLALTPDTFLDASVYPIGGGARAYLSVLGVAPGLVTIWIGDPALARRASAAFDPLDPPDRLALTDAAGRPAGLLLADPVLLAATQAWPAGEHVFDPAATEFAASCTIPTPGTGLQGLATADGQVLAGDVWLIGEDGVVVREEDGAIRIDVVGDPLFARRLCQGEGTFATPNFVRTINGMPPAPDGSFQLTVASVGAADTVLRITPEPPDTLRIGLVGQTIDGGP